ncbi:MAG: DUF4065 domain-containing protein [bacterium]|nr:DUF4065 domain-containing protein [bacterium]
MNKRYLESIRKEHGLSQQQLAERLGLTRQTYAQIEQGERGLSLAEAQKLVKLFDISLDDLASGKKTQQLEVSIDKPTKKPSSEPLNIRISVPQERVDKFREVLMYILNKIGAKPNVGETVLYKLLYFIDFDYYEKYEEQLIGATYIKNHHGPTPVMFKKVVEQMIAAGDVEQVKSKYFQYEQRKYLPRREPNLKDLSAQEIKLIDDVLQRLGNKTARELSDYSHQDVPWVVRQLGEDIHYESVFYRSDKYSVKEFTDEL